VKYSESFYSSVGSRASIAASIVMGSVKQWYSPSSIVDYGAGPGVWSIEAAKVFPNASVLALDYEAATIFSEEFESKRPKNLITLELNFEEEKSIPVVNLDMAICVEVLEHLSEEAANRVFNSICSTAGIVIFSAAVPGQGGTGHINEKPKNYWVSRFVENDFLVFDTFAQNLQHPQVPDYYRNNCFLAINSKFLTSDRLNCLKLLTSLSQNILNDHRSRLLVLRHTLTRMIPSEIVTLIVSKIRK
jgi:hypothetical protein